MALEKANITNGYVFGPGGMVELDADGRPNGIFREQASKIYDNLIPDPFLVPTTREKCMKRGWRWPRSGCDHDAHLCRGDMAL